MNKRSITLAKLRHLADNAGTEGERDAALAAIDRLNAKTPSRNAVSVKAAALLLPHQRTAWLCLAAGGGRLSRTENSFLHRMRDSRWISEKQERWLADIDLRLRWEAGNVVAR